MWGRARPVWACGRGHDLGRDARPTREGYDGLPDAANEAVAARGRRIAIEPIDIRQHGADSRGVAVAGEGWGCCRKETGMTALPPLRGWPGSSERGP